MKLAIMQPYVFPYLGYFQMLAAVDRFVFLDDVNYIKGGWVNRNRLLLSGSVNWFTFPLQGASPNRRINELHVQPDATWRRKLLASVRQSSARAPHFERTYALLSDIVQSDQTSISTLARESVMAVARHLGLGAEFAVSTGRYGNEELRGAHRVLDICRREGAHEYHNLPGGMSLYSEEVFAAAGVELHFVRPKLAEYSQFGAPFQPGLSILDVLMFNDPASTARLVTNEDPV